MKIYNNIIVNNSDFGILQVRIYTGSYSTDISNNIIQGNSADGIQLLWNDNWIFGNTISENEGGIVLLLDSHNNMIKSNTIKDNDNGIILCSESNTIRSNTIMDNNNGIDVRYSCSNTIENNTIVNNGDYGIVLEYYEDIEEIAFSSNNNIVGNVICGQSYGIKVELKCDNNMIRSNHIAGNIQGFYADVSNNNNIEKNNFIGNTKNAYFKTYRKYDITFTQNYWDDLNGASKEIIMGKKALFPLLPFFSFYWFFIPCFKIDNAPAQEPYDIGG